MSKLASVQIITDIKPIENADNISLASVLGWQVVVKKDEFNIGDKVCYIQIDTIVPELPEYEFLRERKFRVRTIKLRKQISQGLIVPLPDGKWKEGDDVTDIMGVKKYEKVDNNPERYKKPRIPKKWYKRWIYLFKYNFFYKLFPKLKKLSRSPFPKNLVPITDEERIQNIPQILSQYMGKLFVVSYKLNGSSITIIHSKIFGKSKFRICSRKFELHDKRNDWYKVFNDTNFKDEVLKLVKYFKTNNIIVQGEAIGKFNGNYHNLQKEQIRLFNIYVNGKRINQKEFIDVCLVNNIPHCPIYKEVILNHSLEEIIAMSEIPDILNHSVNVEGLVWRCVEDNLSFKVINNKYLLKNNE
ncbi:MAG TPA: RNA ligase family protein [Ignavibacteriales bacterium]|nr:RNA ligase family protein [Ignavibacteriales bacterium]